jgi:hypothetical protein
MSTIFCSTICGGKTPMQILENLQYILRQNKANTNDFFLKKLLFAADSHTRKLL